jgi:hypothetical protein
MNRSTVSLIVAIALACGWCAGEASAAVVIADDNAAQLAYEPNDGNNGNDGNPANNTDAWNSGDNGGFGFGAWALSVTGGNAGHFMFRSPTNGDGDGNGDFDIDTPANVNGRSWGMFANSGHQANAVRPFPRAMLPGDIFRIHMDNGWIEGGGLVGLTLEDSLSNDRLSVLFRNGFGDYRYDNFISGEATLGSGLGFTDEGIEIEMVMLSLTSMNVTLTPLAGGLPVSQTIAIVGPIDRVNLFNANAGGGGERNAYFNSMQFTEPAAIPEPGTFLVWGLAMITAGLLTQRERR